MEETDKERLERLKRSFEKTHLDTPVSNRKIKFFPTKTGLKSKAAKVLPEPLVPTKYVPPKPEPEPSPPVPLPRLPRSIPKRTNEEIQKFSDKTTPLYKKEAINAFQKILSDRKSLREIVKEKDRALKNYAKSFEVTIIESRDPTKQLKYTTQYVLRTLEDILQGQKGLKVNVTLYITLKKRKVEDGPNGPETFYEFKNVYFNSKTFTITNNDQILEELDQASEEILNRIAGWISKGSGWAIEKNLSHHVNVARYSPLEGSSYIPLPEELRNSNKGLVNLRNEDPKCFLWCHVRHLNPQKKDPHRIKLSDREFEKRLDSTSYSGITYPVTINQIPQIEKQNQININLFGYHQKIIFPIN